MNTFIILAHKDIHASNFLTTWEKKKEITFKFSIIKPKKQDYVDCHGSRFWLTRLSVVPEIKWDED